MTGAQEIVFGCNPNQVYHAFRYTDAFGLDRHDVIETIIEDLRPNLPLPVPPMNNAPFVGRVIVNGILLSYHAYPVSEALVNVGSITRS